MYELPTTITYENTVYNIRNKGDFRMVLDCFKALDDEELSEQERLYTCLIIFYMEFNSLNDFRHLERSHIEAITHSMFNFFNCGQPEGVGAVASKKVVDWEQDSQIICAAINNVANKEIRFEPYVHWWTFMGYYMSIGECALSTIVNIRTKIVEGKKLEDYERKFRRENPQYFNWNAVTVQRKEADELARKLWNNS